MDLYLFPFNVYLALSSQRNIKNNRTLDLYVGDNKIIRCERISEAIKITNRCQPFVELTKLPSVILVAVVLSLQVTVFG